MRRKNLRYRKSKMVKGKKRQFKKTGRKKRKGSRTRRRRSRVKRGGKWAALNLLNDAQNSTVNSSNLIDMYNGVKNADHGTVFSSYGKE